MTDDAPTNDELVSAVLDGEATADEVARVQADPQLRAQLEQYGAMADQIAAPPAPPIDLRDEQIARAVAEADSWSGGPVAPPIDLGLERRRRARTITIVSIAAAIGVVVIGLAVGRIVTRDDEPQITAADAPRTSDGLDDSAAEEATAKQGDDAATAEGVKPPEAGTGTQGDALATEPSPAVEVIDLGSFNTRPELQAAITPAIDQYLADESGYLEQGSQPPFAPGASAQLERRSAKAECATTIDDGDGEVSTLLWSADATLSGQPLYLFLYATDAPAANGPLRLYAVDQASCTPILGGIQTFTPHL